MDPQAFMFAAGGDASESSRRGLVYFKSPFNAEMSPTVTAQIRIPILIRLQLHDFNSKFLSHIFFFRHPFRAV